MSYFIPPPPHLPPAFAFSQEVALRMRVGLLQKGGFLHSGFDAVMAADNSINHDFTYAKYVCDELGVHIY